MTAVDVLVAAYDAGGAAAIAPVLRGIHQGPRWSITTIAGGPAREILADVGGVVVPWDASSAESLSSFVSTQLHTCQPRLVLTGTSLQSGLERTVTRTARRAHIPTLAILDSWANYAARFKEPEDDALRDCDLPDAIGVMDDLAAAEMAKEGFPPNRLRIIGHPDIDDFVRWVRSREAVEAARVERASLRVADGSPLIVYFSQPIAAIDAARSPADARGYDERDAWGAFADAVERLGRPLTIAVKSHPADRIGRTSYPSAIGRANVRLVTGDSVHILIAAADMAVGMTSIALVKAWLAGRPVLSIQPALRGPDLLVLGRMGVVKPVVNTTELPAVLQSVLDGQVKTSAAGLPTTWTDGRATERAISLIHETLTHTGGCR